MKMNYLYHGTNYECYLRLLQDGALAHEYIVNDCLNIGFYVTDNIRTARSHGLYILELNLNYKDHLIALEVCRLNKTKQTGEILNIEIENECSILDMLDEGMDECWINGVINFGDVVSIYIQEGEPGTDNTESSVVKYISTEADYSLDMWDARTLEPITDNNRTPPLP